MMLDIGMIVAGLLLLFSGGECLVRGSVALSHRFGVSTVLIGVVVVGFGTSTPELLVSIKASLNNQPDIALGNVVGSNIANVLLILGSVALFAPIACKDRAIIRDAFATLLASALLFGLTFLHIITQITGALMLLSLILYLFYSYRKDQQSKIHQHTTKAEEEIIEEYGHPNTVNLGFSTFLTLGGIVMLIFGADFLVDGASNVARVFGISEAVIGLSLVAIGTSLPELAAAFAAALKKEPDLIIGNILGSNLFNILSILGITAIIKPIPLAGQIADFDIPLSLLISLILLIIIAAFKNINRLIGLLCLGAYVVYITWLYISGGINS